MGAGTHVSQPDGFQANRLKPWALFCIHQSLASWGVIVAAPFILFNLVDVANLFGLYVPNSNVQWFLYGTPYFLPYVLIAVALGWLLGGLLRHPVMLWVWVLPLLVLCAGVIRYPHIPTPSHITVMAVLGTYPWQQFVPLHGGGVGIAAALAHFFGWGHGFQPYDQVLVVVPFYTSFAYSLGALLARPATHPSPFFDRLRNVQVWRLTLATGLPWFIIRAIKMSQWVESHTLFYGTAINLLISFGALLVGSASLVLLSAVIIALVGPRPALTRFFMRERRG